MERWVKQEWKEWVRGSLGIVDKSERSKSLFSFFVPSFSVFLHFRHYFSLKNSIFIFCHVTVGRPWPIDLIWILLSVVVPNLTGLVNSKLIFNSIIFSCSFGRNRNKNLCEFEGIYVHMQASSLQMNKFLTLFVFIIHNTSTILW